MKQVILGTAGHIDHGKTTLVKALTGIETDRLKEEKERGITIELGFAHLELPGGRLIGIVDVPGHEKFVKNMVAGATGIDIVALVIAADEGVMPQTREHLEICQLLDIRHGLVVLTKIDMVDEEWLELVKEDLREFLADSFLSDAPVVEVSAVTGEGIPELLETLDSLVKTIPQREPGLFFRLPIDRVFVMKGFGTVVTGTTISGEIHTGDEVTVYPKGIIARIRGIQVHNREVEESRAGLRTAINLQGVEKAELRRGDIVATRDSLKTTFMADVVLDLLPSAPRILKNRARVRFHTGTSEIISTVVLLDREELKPGERCFAQIRMEEPTALLPHDRFVLRSYSPVRAIGGGKILHALPRKKKRFSGAVLKELEILDRGDLGEVTEQFVREAGFRGLEQKDLPFLTNGSRNKLSAALNALMARKKVLQYDREKGVLIHADFLERARKEILETLKNYHRDNPLKIGLLTEELRSRTVGSRNPKLFNYILGQLIGEGILVQEKELVRFKEHRVTLARDQEKARAEIEKTYLEAGLTPPYFKELKEKFPGGSANDVLGVMLEEGTLVKVKEDLYFHRQALEELEKRLVAYLRENGEIDTPRFKEMTNASRKYTIPLLEYFDRTQVTVRVGDSRVLRKK